MNKPKSATLTDHLKYQIEFCDKCGELIEGMGVVAQYEDGKEKYFHEKCYRDKFELTVFDEVNPERW